MTTKRLFSIITLRRKVLASLCLTFAFAATSLGALLSGPIIIGPGTASDTGSTTASLTPTFTWNSVSGASSYNLFISKEPYGIPNIIYQLNGVTGNSRTIPSGYLQNGVKYRWNMSTNNSSGTGSVNNTLYFKAPAAAVAPPSISSISPNPVTGSSSAQTFTVSGGSFVSGAKVQVAYAPNYTFVNTNTNASYVSATTLTVPMTTSTTADVWKVRVVNPDGQTSGQINLTVNAPVTTPAPSATTNAASSVTSSSAQMNATINPNGYNTTAYFQYGTTASYGGTTGSGSFGSGTSAISINSNNTGLASSTTFHYRVVASNSGGTSYGGDITFTTATAYLTPPTLSSPSSGSGGQSTTPTFSWSAVSGADAGYRIMVATNPADLPTDPTATAGGGSVMINATPSSNSYTPTTALNAGTTYYWQVHARSSALFGTWSGVYSFTTLAAATPPTVQTLAASSITTNSAQMNATVNPNGSNTTAYFEYGPTASYGGTTGTGSFGNGSSAVAIQSINSGLNSNTLFHYRVVAINSGGTTYGNDVTFTTAVVPAPSISSITPNPVTGSSSPQTFTVSGGSFVSGAKVQVAYAPNYTFVNTNTNASYVSATTLTVPMTTSTTADVWKVRVLNPDGQTSGQINLTVNAPGTTPAFSITTTAFVPATATVGTGYSAQQAVVATGGQTPYSWSASGLPNGMGINSSSGAVFGTPTVAGTFSVTVTAQDSSSPQKTASKVLTLTVSNASSPAPSISSISPNPVTGSSTPQTFTVSGSNFVSGAKVQVAYKPSYTFVNTNTNASYVSATTLTVPVTTSTTQDVWKVRVVNPDGQTSGQINLTVNAPTAVKSNLVVVGALSVSPSPVTAGNTLTVGINITNIGPGNAPATTTHLQIKDTALTTTVGDQTYATPAISAGQTISQSYTITVPPGTTPGNYNAYVKVDSGNSGNQSSYSDDYGASNVFAVNAPAGTSSLNGFAYDLQSGQSLANVVVTLASAAGTYSQTTNGGYYSFTGIAQGTYTLSANLAGYSFSPISVNLTGTLSQPIYMARNFTNNPTSTLSGRMTDASTGAGLAGKTVSLGSGITPAVTDSNGYYTFPSFASGSYAISVSVSGYLSYSQPITIAGAQTQPIPLTRNQIVLGGKTNSGYSADPVNTATGNYIYTKVDLKLPGPGMGFVFERNYNSQDASASAATAGPLGFGWNHTYNVQLTVDGANNVTLRWGDSKADTYNPDQNGGFTPQPHLAIFDKLTASAGGGYALLRKDQTRYNFDASNRLASIVDKNGNTTALAYTGGNLATITDTGGRLISFTYDASNRMTKITDPLNRTIQFAYDASGNPISVIDTNGKTTNFTYDASHQVLTVIDPRGNTLVTNVYDAAKRVVTSQKDAKQGQTTYDYSDPNKTIVTQPLGRVTTDHHDNYRRLVQQDDAIGKSTLYTYDVDTGNRTSVTNKNVYTTTYAYDAVGNVIGKTDPLGHTTAIKYDAKNNPLTRTDEAGNTTSFQYDANGNLNKTTDALGGIATATYTPTGLPLTITDALLNKTILAYDPQGNLTTVTDALANATIHTYDAAGRRLTTKDALLHVSTFAYDGNDNVLSVTDPATKTVTFIYDENNNKLSAMDKRGKTTFYTYDVKDLLRTITDPLQGVVTNSYDALDQKISVTDANTGITQYGYDLVGNLITVTDALGKATQYAYDPNGNRISAKNPLLNTAFISYDALDRPVQTTDPLGNTTKTEYDALGRRAKVTDANAKVTTFLYDALGHLVKATDANGGTVDYAYDAAGNRTSMTDPNGHTTTYTYDTLNRLAQTKDPSNGIYLNGYDTVGNLVSRKDPNGNTMTYTYDVNNRRTGIAYPAGAPVAFTYDSNGNRIGMTDGLGASAFQYDELNRMTSATDAYGKTVGYGYDPNGNRVSMTYPGNKTVSYAYDADNHLKTVTDWLTHVTSYSYDDSGNPIGTANPNGTTAAYAYDIAGRLTGLANVKADATAISNYTLTLDKVGNHKASAQNEPLLPIVAAQSVNYAYDSDNRLTTAGATACTYDANGNLTARGSDTFGYDFENRLTQDSVGGTAAQFQYDGTGNRKSAVTAAGTKRFILDTNGSLSHVLADTDATGTVNAYYIYGRGLVSRIASNGTALYYHYDVRGSTIALTDAAGNPTDQYAYDPFGKIANSLGTSANPFKYVGKYGVMDEGNGLAYVRARYFSPDLGRFITKDPLTGTDGDSQGLHRYVYALNNPVMLVDVSGYTAIDILADQATQGTNLFSTMTYKALSKSWSAKPVSYAGTGPTRDASKDGGEQFDLNRDLEIEYANAYWWVNLKHPFSSDDKKDRLVYEKLDERRKSQEVVIRHDNDMAASESAWYDLSNPKVVEAHQKLGLSSPDVGIRIGFQFLGAMGSIVQTIAGTPTIPETSEVNAYKTQTYKK